jgi:EmrB/QacA subfamily drug resistance transporter
MITSLYRQLRRTLFAPTDTNMLPNEYLMIVTLTLSAFLVPFNSTMMPVALPQIQRAFNADISLVGWLVTGYLITMASLQLVSGKLGDRVGRRPLILSGLMGLWLASLGAALSSSIYVLLFFRVLQAMSGAIALPNGVALIREVVPAERRASRLGMTGAGLAFGGAAGPPLSGLLIGAWGWRAIFLVNIPMVLLVLLLGWWFIPRALSRGTTQLFDLMGAILVPAVLLGISGLLTQSRNMSPSIIAAGAVIVVVLLVTFLWHELRHPDPVFQPRLFRIRSFAVAIISTATNNLVYFSTLLTIPALLANGAGWTPQQIGLVLITLSATVVICSPLGGYLSDHFGRRWPTVGGLLLLTLGELTLSLASNSVSTPLLLLGLAMTGTGAAIPGASLQAVVVESVEPSQAGAASGVQLTGLFLGSIIGSSLLIRLFDSARNDPKSYGPIFLMIAAASLMSALLGLLLYDRQPRKQGD